MGCQRGRVQDGVQHFHFLHLNLFSFRVGKTVQAWNHGDIALPAPRTAGISKPDTQVPAGDSLQPLREVTQKSQEQGPRAAPAPWSHVSPREPSTDDGSARWRVQMKAVAPGRSPGPLAPPPLPPRQRSPTSPTQDSLPGCWCRKPLTVLPVDLLTAPHGPWAESGQAPRERVSRASRPASPFGGTGNS